MKSSFLYGIEKDIEDILFKYVAVRSDTNTILERDVEKFWLEHFEKIEYFHNNPQHVGLYKIPGDLLGRSVSYALLKGQGEDTVVLLHHNDVVDVEDFKSLQHLAYSPLELAEELKKISHELLEEAREDLLSGEYYFGRGVCDMKGGAAIQMALLERYSKIKDFKGNILLVSVPDEENLSAGMRGAVVLMDELKSKYDLKYLIAINSEPHQRMEKAKGVFSEGSVGKTMFFFYVRGSLAHAGKIFEGVNALNILSEIVRGTELNLDFSDFVAGEASPPPTWLYIKDRKTHYDVSMPLGAGGYLSVLSLNSEPEKTMEHLKEVSTQAFTKVIENMNEKYKIFREKTNKSLEKLPWEAKVVSYKELYDEANENHGDAFIKDYEKKYKEIYEKLSSGQMDMLESNLQLTELIFNYIDNLSPRVVIGIAPPYYPCVTNSKTKSSSTKVEGLIDSLIGYAREELGEDYETEKYFTGISDLSYTSIENSRRTGAVIKDNMPHFGRLYDIPFEKIERISMPGVNIGPWGKDFHKISERVLIKDLFYNTPRLLHKAITMLLEN